MNVYCKIFVGRCVLQVPNLLKGKEGTAGDRWITLLAVPISLAVVFNNSLQSDQDVAGHNKSTALEMNI